MTLIEMVQVKAENQVLKLKKYYYDIEVAKHELYRLERKINNLNAILIYEGAEPIKFEPQEDK